MFKGKYNHTIDVKNRIIVPVKLRSELGDTFVVTRGIEKCLYIYPNSEWDKFTESLSNVPGTEKSRRIIRDFMSNAADCEVDKQGRILIPSDLCEKAGLEKDVIFIGVLNKIELWSKEILEDDQNDIDMNEYAEELAKYGVRF